MDRSEAEVFQMSIAAVTYMQIVLHEHRVITLLIMYKPFHSKRRKVSCQAALELQMDALHECDTVNPYCHLNRGYSRRILCRLDDLT